MDKYRNEYQKALEQLEVDAGFLQNLKEAKIAGIGAFIFAMWAMINALLLGYGQTMDTLSYTMGVPTWFFNSTLVTGVVILIFQIWLSLFVIRDNK